MKNRKKLQKAAGKMKLIVYMSAIVFAIVYITVGCFFSMYTIIRTVPFLDFEMLPTHHGFYLITAVSIIIGIILSFLCRSYLLVPLQQSYNALAEVADGNFKVNVSEKGIRAVRRVGKNINIMAKELESIETMRSDFVNNFSHEFKTPIISISGFAKMLKNSDLSPEEKEEYLDIIISESERLSKLATNVLTLSKLDNQTFSPDKADFNVTEQLRRAVILLERKWVEKNITIDFDCSEHYAYANEELLNQVWINLLDNAIRFSPVDSRIRITVEKNNNCLSICVEDSGEGMDETVQKHVFDRFFQGDLSHKGSGHGIGLAIAKKVCELNDGSIRIKKSDESGTVFEVILPAKK